MSMPTETVAGIDVQKTEWPSRHRARWLARTLAGVLSAIAIAACGSSGLGATGGGSTVPGSSDSAALAMSECMHSHGVPNFPDPTQSPGGEGLSVNRSPGSSTVTVAGIPFSGPAFTAAARACRFGPGGRGHRGVPESTKVKELAFARCMRAHGVPNFPDPSFPAGGRIERPEVAGLSLNSLAVQRAEVTCNR